MRDSRHEICSFGEFLPIVKEVAIGPRTGGCAKCVHGDGSGDWFFGFAVCEHNQVLWIADTGCGSNLVPESDVVRGVPQVFANRG